jgi:flagellar basal body rod protein FlgB
MPGGKLTLVSTHAQHLPAGPRSASVFEKEPGEGKLDRNRVDLDAQVAELSENALLHEASITLFSRTMGGLRYAISEGRG